MKEWLAQTGFISDAGTIGSDLSYLLAVVFTFLFMVAWVLAKKGEGNQHHKLIFISMMAMLIYFILYYFFRQLGVLALEGKEGFGGPEEIYNNVFIPILSTHLFLVTFGLIMALYMIIEGFRASERNGNRYVLKSGGLKMNSRIFRKVIIILII